MLPLCGSAPENVTLGPPVPSTSTLSLSTCLAPHLCLRALPAATRASLDEPEGPSWAPDQSHRPHTLPSFPTVHMPPAAAVVPDVTADAFRALSPADRLHALTPRDSFPCTGAAWNPLARELLLTLHHHPSGVLCTGLTAEDPFLASVSLMWAVATDSLAHLDMESLRNHANQTAWITYGMALDSLVAFHAQATPAQLTDLHSEAALFVARYGDQSLRTMSQDEFLMVLSGEHEIKPPAMRLPVVFWLLSWAAKQAGSALACPDLLPADPPSPVPTNCVLTSNQWVKELRSHGPDGDGKLCHPGLLMRLYASKERWRKEAAEDAAEDPWLLQLRSLSSTDASDFLTRLDSLAAVPENKAEEHAQPLLTLARAHQLGSKAYGNINGVRTTAALVGVAKSLWLTCPSYRQPMLRADLSRYVDVIEEKFENNNLQDLKTKSLEAVVKLLERHDSHGIPYGDVARKLAMHAAVSDKASQSLLVVSSEDSFRLALVHTYRGIETKTGVTQVMQTLQQELKKKATDTAFDWVLRRGATPTQPAPPHTPATQRIVTPGVQDSLLPPSTTSAASQPRASPPGRRLLMLRDLDSVGEANLMSASVQLTHLLVTPITLTPIMVKRRVGVASVDESVWASLFSSCTERTYLDTASVPPRWSVTIASTRPDGSPVTLTSDACDASSMAPPAPSAAPRDKAKRGNKRPPLGELPDARRPPPQRWDPSSDSVVVGVPGRWAPPLPAPWPATAPPAAPGNTRGVETAPFDGVARR